MNVYVRTAVEFYGLLLKVLEIFQFLLMCLCNNSILLIKQIDEDDTISYVIPSMSIVLYRGYVPKFCNQIEVYPLSYVYHVNNCKLQRAICKDRCVYDIHLYINFLNEIKNYKNKDEISKNYMFVELGCVNITSEFKEIAWCLMEEDKYKVSELKKLISNKNVKSTDSLIITDNDLNIKEFDDDEVITLGKIENKN